MGFLGNLLNLTGELVDLAVEVPMAPRSIIDQKKKEIDDNFIKILKICGVNCKIKSTYFSSDANHHENGKNYIISDINMGDYGNMESYLFKRGYSKESIEYCKNKLDNLVIIKQNEDFSLRDARIQAFESALKTDPCSDERFIITVHVVNQYLHEVEADCHRIADYFDSHGNKSECNIVMGGENRYINHSETWLLVVPKGYDAKGYYYDVCDKLNIKRDDYKHKSSKLNGRIRANKKTDVTKEPEVIYDVEFIENYESALKTLECHEIQLNLEINEIRMYRPEIKSECNNLKHYFNIHGNNASNGGAMDGVTAVKCSFYSNSAKSGGAMYGGSAVKCSFKNNKADYGGAMYGGSAVKCSFYSNSAKSGGAMYGGSAVNCNFIHNSASYGGAKYGGSAVKCSFDSNRAESGGAKYGGSAVKCSFTNNYADVGGAMYRGSASGCSFVKNTAVAEGGGIIRGSVRSCSFVSNYAESGGAISDSSASGCSFKNNKADYGGAMYGGSSAKCTFKGNSAWYGGAMYLGTVVKCTFTANSAHEGGATWFAIAKNSKFIKNEAKEYGGAMYEKRPIKCVFKSNKAGVFGNNLYKSTKIVSSDVSTVYKANKYIVATVNDFDGRPIRGVKVTIKVGSLKKTMKTNSKGQVKLSIKNLAPKSYAAEITCAGNQNYVESSKTVKVTVKKR